MNLKIVAASMLMSGVVITGLLTTSSAEAQKTEPKVNMQHFTAEEQLAANQSARGAPVMLAEAPQSANAVAATPNATSNEPATWSIPAAIWLAASGLAGMGLLQRRKK
jgi:hypothetical protein